MATWRGVEVESLDRDAPIHPGEILRELFLAEYGLTAYSLAQRLHVPRARIEKIVREQRGICADTALRLARLFGTTPDNWLNLQQNYERKLAELQIAEARARGDGGFDEIEALLA
jgi:antitoxin HigA-1